MRRRALLTLLAAPLAAVALLLAQDRRLPLRIWVFRLPGTELGLDVADLDGDGKRDLAIAHLASTVGTERAVSIYPYGPDGQRFSPTPARRVDAPADACAFAVGDFDPAPGGEVAFLCPTRVVLVRASGEAFDAAKVDGFFDYPEGFALPPWDLAVDLDGDGREELLVPTKDGYAVLGCPIATNGASRGTLVERAKIAVAPKTRFGPDFESQLLGRFLTATSRMRRIVAIDINGDGRRDLIGYRNKGLARYHQRPDGTFPDKPDSEAPLVVVKESEAGEAKTEKKESDGSEAFSNVRLDLNDVDLDGKADLVVTKTLGEVGLFSSLRTQQLVFRGRADGSWNEAAPDVLVNLKGVSGDPVFVDVDGDGRRDMVLSSYRMDLFTNVKRAILESMSITYTVHLSKPGAEQLFDEDADVSIDIDLPLSALEKRGGAQPVDFTADVDGDKVRDLVRVRPEGGLLIALGQKGSPPRWEEKDALHVQVERTEPPWVIDMDGDGRSEMILEPFGGDGEPARTVRILAVDR